MHCRSQHCWELLHPFAHHCQHTQPLPTLLVQQCCELLRPFAPSLRPSIVYCKQSIEIRHISSIGCTDKSLKSHRIYFCFYVFGHSLCWSEKIFCLEDVGILHSAKMKICILSTFPAYGKVGVNQNRFGRYELLLKDQNCVLYII